MKRFKLRRIYFQPKHTLYIFTSKCRICGQHSSIFRTMKRWPTGDSRRWVHPHCQGGEV